MDVAGSAAARLVTLEGSLPELGRLQSKNARKEIIDAKLHNSPPLSEMTIEFVESVTDNSPHSESNPCQSTVIVSDFLLTRPAVLTMY